MIEKRITGGICHAIHRYVAANNKYMKEKKSSYNKKTIKQEKKSSYLTCLDANNLYGWAMSQKLPIDSYEWESKYVQINENFIKIMMNIVIKDTIFKTDVEYPKRHHNFRNHLPFLTERMKIKKCNKLVCKRYDKSNYVAHIRTLKQPLN